jgi:hypothetical protein
MPSRLVIVARDASSNTIRHNLFVDSAATTADLDNFLTAYARIVRVGIDEVVRDGVVIFQFFKDPESGSHVDRRLYLTYRVAQGIGDIPRRYYRFALSDPLDEVVSHLVEGTTEPVSWAEFRLNALSLMTDQGGARLDGLLTATYSIRGLGLRAVL